MINKLWELLFEVATADVIAQFTTTKKIFSDVLEDTGYGIDAFRSDDDSHYEILWCIHKRPINDWFYVCSKNKVQGIDSRRTWQPNNGSVASNSPSWICDIKMVTQLT